MMFWEIASSRKVSNNLVQTNAMTIQIPVQMCTQKRFQGSLNNYLTLEAAEKMNYTQ